MRAICVVAQSSRPCGACRQVMLEFSQKDTELICVDLGKDSRRDHITRMPIYKVLPFAFDPLDAGLLPQNPRNLLRRMRRQKKARKAKRHPKARRARKGKKTSKKGKKRR